MKHTRRIRGTLLGALALSLLLLSGPAGAQNGEPMTEVDDGLPPLRLMGTVPGTGQALIWSIPEAAYSLVRVGDEVGGFVVRRLRTDRVLVSRGDRIFELTMIHAPVGRTLRVPAEDGPAGILVAPQASRKRKGTPPVRPFSSVVTLPAPPAAEPAVAEAPPMQGEPADPGEAKASVVAAEAPPAQVDAEEPPGEDEEDAPPEDTPADQSQDPRGRIVVISPAPLARAVAPAAPQAAPAAPAPPAEAQAAPVQPGNGEGDKAGGTPKPRWLSMRSVRTEVSRFLEGKAHYRYFFTEQGLLEVEGIREGTLLHDMGLRNNDRIESVGGRRLNTTDEVMDVYLDLYTQRQVDVVLWRNGERHVLNFSLAG